MSKDCTSIPGGCVIIDDTFCEMMNFAVRYALGRRTYAVYDTVRYLLPLMRALTDGCLLVIERDIEERKRYEGRLGDSCDEITWNKLLEAVQAERLRRSEKGIHI